jgi:hypothetical protein
MANVGLAYKNILETSTVYLQTGSAQAAYPLWRLYDRDIGRIFAAAAASTLVVQVDQGASGNIAVDSLFIPAGHNLSGLALSLAYSADNSAYTNAVTAWTQADALDIIKTWTAITRRYWRFSITSPAKIPQFAELFLSSVYTWETNPLLPKGAYDPVFNVAVKTTAAGQDRFLIQGAAKRRRSYTVSCDETQAENISAFYDAYAGYKPFWLRDDDGIWIYGRLSGELQLTEDEFGMNYNFDFIEVVA